MDALRTGLSFLAGYEDPAFLADTSREANLRKGLHILARAPIIAANAYRALQDLQDAEPVGAFSVTRSPGSVFGARYSALGVNPVPGPRCWVPGTCERPHRPTA
jgi:hypothetical protein